MRAILISGTRWWHRPVIHALCQQHVPCILALAIASLSRPSEQPQARAEFVVANVAAAQSTRADESGPPVHHPMVVHYGHRTRLQWVVKLHPRVINDGRQQPTVFIEFGHLP